MEYSAVIVAAGSGSRMGLGFNKVYAKLNDSESILEKTIHVFLQDSDCDEIIVVTNPREYMSQIPGDAIGKIVLCSGGATRQESVNNGLQAVIGEYVMIHDGARPFLNRSCLDALKQTMMTEQAALLTVPCKDTIKRVVNGYVAETYERASLAAAQTPQVFTTKLIMACMKRALKEGYTGTDDASLVEKYSQVKVKAVDGSYENIKITTPTDLK